MRALSCVLRRFESYLPDSSSKWSVKLILKSIVGERKPQQRVVTKVLSTGALEASVSRFDSCLFDITVLQRICRVISGGDQGLGTGALEASVGGFDAHSPD